MRLNALTTSLLLPFFFITVLTACNEGKVEEKEKIVYEVPVETTFIENRTITNTYRTTAVLEAKSESKVTNKVDGMIDKIHVEEGMSVTKGQVLAEIDSENYLLELERTTIDVDSAVAEYNRSRPIDGKQLIPAKDLEKLEFLVKTRKNQQKVAKIKVRDAKVRAPISGVIASRMAKEGNMTANAGSEMFTIVALDTLQGVVYLPEAEMNNVHINQQAFLNFPANEKSIPATVALISPIIDTESGTFKVTLKVNNDDHAFKPGMFAKVSLTLDVHDNAQIVPQKALLVTDTETSLFVIQDHKAKKVTVVTGFEQDGFVEILTPLNAEEPIVIVGQQGLKVDSPVKIIGEEVIEEQNAELNTDNNTAKVTVDNQVTQH
ncbi:MAG: efflux RND transporter periplasmic adaptor subunit [Alteromonadaceae bacterium]|jgi:RND family efflux transporter MFP subunit